MNNQIEYCCNTMKEQLTYQCVLHPDQTCPDIIITRSTTFRPIGLVEYTVSPHYTLWGRNAEYFCEFCPWCGTDLGYKAYRKDVETLFAEEAEECLPQNGKQDTLPEAG
jgi:hypothetical protein